MPTGQRQKIDRQSRSAATTAAYCEACAYHSRLSRRGQNHTGQGPVQNLSVGLDLLASHGRRHLVVTNSPSSKACQFNLVGKAKRGGNERQGNYLKGRNATIHCVISGV